jgi:hypothetical protein
MTKSVSLRRIVALEEKSVEYQSTISYWYIHLIILLKITNQTTNSRLAPLVH